MPFPSLPYSIVRAVCVPFLAGALASGSASATPSTVYFPDLEGKTELVAYLYAPHSEGPAPAVVLLHGRSGPYSSRIHANCTWVTRATPSPCSAETLSRRHQMWAQYWAEHGYIALLLDSFGPRGKAHGFGRHTHDDPERAAVNERTVRPADVEAALNWLAARPEVRPDRLFVHGWSNGASTVLNVMQRQAQSAHPRARVAAALAFYPGCGPKALLAPALHLDAPTLLLLGSEDEEVSPALCRDVAARSTGPAGALQVQWYEGATHDFDDPGTERQANPANRRAKEDTLQRAAAYFERISGYP